MNLTRRRALTAASVFIPAALLAACGIVTTTTTNGITTITANVARINAWGAAFINAAELISALPGIADTRAGMVVSESSMVITADLSAFAKAAGSAVTLTFDATSIPASMTSLLNDGTTLLHVAQAALPSATGAAVSDAGAYIMALQTIVSLFTALVAAAPTTTAAAVSPMAEKRALAVLGVRR
jgi:hypothetical protein